jgi:large subunit ribosomal protein L4
MKLTIQDTHGQPKGELEVKFELVDPKKGNQAVHDTVTAYRAAQRLGTACTKTMGEVAGSGKKPWRQKGTGRARAGSFRSPLWRGGGVVFGPKPRDYTKKVNQKTKALALRKALTERLKAGDVIIVDDLKIETPKTKAMVAVLKALKLDGTTLLVQSGNDKNVRLSARNIPDLAVTTGANLNTYDVLRPDKLVFTRAAFEQVEARLAKPTQEQA